MNNPQDTKKVCDHQCPRVHCNTDICDGALFHHEWHCGRCHTPIVGDTKEEILEHWEKEFDKTFPAPKPAYASYPRIYADVKAFISSTILSAQREERERCLQIIEKQRIHGDNSRNWEYVNACEDIANALTSSSEEEKI